MNREKYYRITSALFWVLLGAFTTEVYRNHFNNDHYVRVICSNLTDDKLTFTFDLNELSNSNTGLPVYDGNMSQKCSVYKIKLNFGIKE